MKGRGETKTTQLNTPLLFLDRLLGLWILSLYYISQLPGKSLLLRVVQSFLELLRVVVVVLLTVGLTYAGSAKSLYN